MPSASSAFTGIEIPSITSLSSSPDVFFHSISTDSVPSGASDIVSIIIMTAFSSRMVMMPFSSATSIISYAIVSCCHGLLNEARSILHISTLYACVSPDITTISTEAFVYLYVKKYSPFFIYAHNKINQLIQLSGKTGCPILPELNLNSAAWIRKTHYILLLLFFLSEFGDRHACVHLEES